MIKLTLPQSCEDYSLIIDSCCENIKDPVYKNKILDNKHNLIRISRSYIKLARKNFLFKYKKYKLNNKNSPIKISNNSNIPLLTNSEIGNLYTYYFVQKRCGEFYDKLINHAKNSEIQCPFCGGIGIPNELDHFLPKSNFGYYAIFPYNLIPICKDCNQKYKKDFYATTKNEQLIHPYLDNDCYYKEQWLFANINIDSNDVSKSTAKFYINPPNTWEIDKINKVKFHFNKFDLEKRFSIKATSDLSDIFIQIIESKKDIPINNFIKCIIKPVIDNYGKYKTNNWKRVLYQAIENQLADIWDKA